MTHLKIYGPPGTGKTTRLLFHLGEFLKKYPSKDICVMSHTKESVNEFRERAKTKFNLSIREDMEYFRTMHSLCFHLLDLDAKENSAIIHHEEFCREHGIAYLSSKKKQTEQELEDIIIKENEEVGNKIFKLYTLFVLTQSKTVREVTEEVFLQVLYKTKPEIINEIQRNLLGVRIYDFLCWWEAEKTKKGWYDFCDMLLHVYLYKLQVPCKVLLVDESQDFGLLQIKILKMWRENMEHSIVVGDEDQGLFGFSGAKPDYFLNLKADVSTILKQSYRVPYTPWRLAKTFIEQNTNRQQKDYKSTEMEGSVQFFDHIIKEDLLKMIDPNKKTFLLFRTNHQKAKFVMTQLIKKGIPYKNIGRAKSPWSDRVLCIHNAIIKLLNDVIITYEEVVALLTALPSDPFLLHGTKKKLKDGKLYKKRGYTKAELLLTGCTTSFFKLKTYEDFLQVLVGKTIGISNSQYNLLSKTPKKILSLPRLYVSTFHSIKGKEADDVFVFTDLPLKVYKAIKDNDQKYEEERRVFYVGMTRTKDRLCLINKYFAGSYDLIEKDIMNIYYSM